MSDKKLATAGKLSAVVSKLNNKTSKNVPHKVRVHIAIPHSMSSHRLHTMVSAARGLVNRRISLLAQKTEFERKYVGLDAKGVLTTPFDDGLELVKAQLETLRGMARESFGKEGIQTRLTVVLGVPNTAANLNQRALTLDCSNSPDWAAFASLFDEIKTFSVDCTYFPYSNTVNVAGATQVGASVFAYDVEDLTALTNLSQGLAYTEHKQYLLAMTSNATTGSSVVCTSTNKPHYLRCSVPKGDLIVPPANVAGVSFCVGQAWVPTTGTAGTVDPVGALKWFENNATNINITVGTIVEQFHVHFRMRF